jgi:peptide/nickel transport system permease protein
MEISDRVLHQKPHHAREQMASAARISISKKWRRVLLWGLVVLALLSVGLLSDQIAPQDPLAVSPDDRLKAPGTILSNHVISLLGTDGVGRDVFSRILAGARLSLLIGIGSVLVAGAFGTLMGLVAGYSGGRVENIIMRLVDIQMAFPSILLALAIAAALGASVINLILALGFSFWTSYARLSRSSVLSIKEKEYVTGARVVGAGDARILFRHILPNASNPIMVLATLHVGQMIISEASLSYLGLGIQPPDISWGGMIANGRDYLGSAWWAATFPGIAIALTVLVMGLFGDAVRDALDPKFRFN